MLPPHLFASKFAVGLPYPSYIATAKPNERANWDAFHARVHLTESQRTLIRGFQRRINVLVLSGTWCGDCVQQCPMLDHIADVHRAPGNSPDAPGIDLRFLDRDQNRDLADPLMICGGLRVPTVVFLNEEFEFLGILADRTLSRYRALAAKYLGPSCPLPGAPVPTDEIDATLQDWINEFERISLLLRLSPKLRQKHND